MAQSIDWLGNQYANVPYIRLPKVGGGTAQFTDASVTTAVAADVASGKKFLLADGSEATGTASGGSGMNMQAYIGQDTRTANSYGATAVKLTVAKTGTYKVSWTAWRSSSSGTMGTNLHVNSTSGTNQQTFTSTYGQRIELTNQRYNAGDVLTLYATSGSTTRSIIVANLIIEQTA